MKMKLSFLSALVLFSVSPAMADYCSGGRFFGADGVSYDCRELTLKQACDAFPTCKWIIEPLPAPIESETAPDTSFP